MVAENSPMQATDKTQALVGAIVKWRAITHQGLLRSQNEDAHWVSHSVEAKNDMSRLRGISSLLPMDWADTGAGPSPAGWP